MSGYSGFSLKVDSPVDTVFFMERISHGYHHMGRETDSNKRPGPRFEDLSGVSP